MIPKAAHRTTSQKGEIHKEWLRTGSTPLSAEVPIREGQILTGPLFSEPMQVETVRPNGPDAWVAFPRAPEQVIPEL